LRLKRPLQSLLGVLAFGPRPSPWTTDGIIREELFSMERLEQHAASLAEAQSLTSRRLARVSLNTRLNDNATALLRAYRTIVAALRAGQTITPAAEWLVDNYPLVQEQIRQIQDDLPPRYYRQLPRLASGPFAGYPRLFGIAWACIAHSDSRFDFETLRRFVHAYQQVQPLTIGELWAVAITLRIVLVENLRRAADRIVSSRAARHDADQVADRLLGTGGVPADPDALLRLHEQQAPFSATFIVQIIKRLRDHDPREIPALAWLETQLAAQGTTSEQMVRDEHQRQGASNVTVRNIITSMRLISDTSWPEFFEDVSLVDGVLRAASDFAGMDFATRDMYRGAIEVLARGCPHSELEIARVVMKSVTASGATSERMRDPGYYLLAGGRNELERTIGYRAPWRSSLRRLNRAIGPAGYIIAVLMVSAVVLTLPVLTLQAAGLASGALIIFALLGLIPAVDVAVPLVNRAAAGEFGATMLPGLALRDGIPAHARTLLVVPVLLTTADAITTQIERLEVHYLSAPQGELYFALLSDWSDAATQSLESDALLLELAVAGIARLNHLHGRSQGSADAGERFLLLHRRRVWSEGQRQWMGWERKRGKLHELNRLLRGARDTTFIGSAGEAPRVPTNIRYVITLDADTRLPRETVRRLIGKLAHPLNQPRIDATTQELLEGYAILQPRVTPSLPIGREGSLFQRVFSSMTGIDAYDAVASDLYQDLFAAGSYAGKGIYDVDAFEAALAGRVPEGSLLSHDLLEGSFANAGLVSDIEVVEEFPSRYDIAAARTHRWARGDWQLLPWLFGRRHPDPRVSGLSLIGAWKILDNLRRTLSAPASLLALAAGCLLPLHAALLWTTFVLLCIAVPVLIPILASLVRPQRRITFRSHFHALGRDLYFALLQVGLLITFLAHQAWLMTDAILRTLFRLGISQRNLLQWVTAAQTQLSDRLSLRGFYRHMATSPLTALLALLGATSFGTGGVLWLVLLFVVLWMAAPAIARRISVSPLVAGRVSVTAAESLALRLIARRTWRYFETFVTAADHMLPPDNFQEDPHPVLAHRTSPTNIGLYLLCVVSARDFGWTGTLDSVERLEATLTTMGRLARFRGHFYNWYDTRDLRPLEPPYVSSVDSGNLAAHLITLANACHEWLDVSISIARRIAGIADAIGLLRAALQALPDDRRTQAVTRQQLEDVLDALDSALHENALREGEMADADLVIRVAELAALAAILVDAAHAIVSEHGSDMQFWAEATRAAIDSWHRDITLDAVARTLLAERLLSLETSSRQLAMAMQFSFLLDPQRQLLTIGYHTGNGLSDSSCYDLLASEARLGSFFAIAKNDVPTRHWFRLGRAVTPINQGAALISWSGSMFEYLMPSLVMRAPAGSLVEHTNRLIVRRQIDYGITRGVPWGISESAYNARDLEFTYQYSNFGVPGLGLKRGLSESLVIAPYATALAAMVDPQAATANFARLTALGAYGRHGFYEALDYTRTRLPDETTVVIVRAFMAHHQGMSVVAIANVLFDGVMRARFHAEPSVQATELLLQERTPRDLPVSHPRAEEVATAERMNDVQLWHVRKLRTPHHVTPQTHLLSNGRYSVMLTSAGSGYSRWGDLAINRWREDATRDDAGSYIFLRDVASGSVWSAGYQPTGVEPDSYEVTFAEDHAEFRRSDAGIITTMKVVISSEDDVEVRRISLTNTGETACDIDVTSYCELVLAPPASDTAHPAFSKLFIQTEFVPGFAALLATRRRRSPGEAEIWAAHHAVIEARVLRPVEFETDRAQFLGRGHEARAPIAVTDGRPLSNTVGTVLDPIFALRYRVRIEPNATARLSFWTAVAASRSAALSLLDQQQDANAFARAATLAWTQAQVQLRHLGVAREEATLFQRLAGYALYAHGSMRPTSDVIQRSSGARAALWVHGISGDLPIVLLKIDASEDIEIARQLLRAHEYWRLKHLAVDLVIINERAHSYIQDLQAALETAVRMSQARAPMATGNGRGSGHGSVFVLRADLLFSEARAVLSSVCRVVLVGQRGSLEEQLESRVLLRKAHGPRLLPSKPSPSPGLHTDVRNRVAIGQDLQFFNGVGGFSADGREYVIRLDAGRTTPVPWINVIANPSFGFQVAAEGSGYTWSMNSRENQITQWSNDPETDRPGEVLYVRDEDTLELWSPTAAALPDADGTYDIRHGQGYSHFEHIANGIDCELLQYVPLRDPIKICRLLIRNTSRRPRRLTVTAYVEWVLGTRREASAPFIVTQIDPQTGAMLARNSWNTEFAARVAFADLDGRQTQWTGDRHEFLGRHGTLQRPAALLENLPLSGRVGAGFDPCCALQAPLEISAGESAEIVFLLGEGASANEVQALLAHYRTADLDAVLDEVKAYWDEVLGVIQVKTPDRALDIMLNRWLLYQTLACRVWARSAFYQASGAYGFRDQLQDGMALAVARPALTREHLLRATERQFAEGDVQHWWLPSNGQGVRTRISDDRIWLAYAVVHYLDTTGDATLLDECLPFLTGPPLQAGQHDAFFTPTASEDSVTCFEHCARALDASLALGAHGLPLIGTGDWNDGMNRVGEHGQGESVWLGWFLHSTLSLFAPIANARNEQARGARWLAHAATLRESLEREAWDGAWYRRGYFDDGAVFGSATNEECRIDSIAQSWAVISGAADPTRAALAMAAVNEQLIRREDALALLFTPPFDRSPLDPGYIKGYPPGLRENGGQYTHAAAWAVIAFARLGQGDLAAELFSMLNPINHARTRAGMRRYKVEPYVVAADIYSVAPQVGRGGWTWYTGSAGWMYRAGIEGILGLRQQGDCLLLAPCIPRSWPRFEITFKYRSACYEIVVENPAGVCRGVVAATLDGVPLEDLTRVVLRDDGALHRLQVQLGQQAAVTQS
jgi:cyclic beta-1,2-glucan synthetase